MKNSTQSTLENSILEFIEMNLAFLDEEVALEYDDNIFELGYVDSLFALQLVSHLEEAFGIEITDQDLDISNFSSVKAIVEFVSRKRD
jgi:acyl carrier protein